MYPTHAKRTPYLFHFEGQTVALGEAQYLHQINELLVKAGKTTRPTFWDQVYLEQVSSQTPYPALTALEDLGGPGRQNMLNSVGTSLSPQAFWEALEKGLFASMPWPRENQPLYLPQFPSWLTQARAWEYDPVAPPDGPGQLGGWTRLQGSNQAGQPLGLFQLTDPHSFWVLGSAADLAAPMQLCRDLAPIRQGFDQATGYLDESGHYSCLALPLQCRSPLEEELFIAGVDKESLFWE